MIEIKDIQEIRNMADDYTTNQVSELSKHVEWLVYCSELISQIKSLPINNIKFDDVALYDVLRQWQMQSSFILPSVDKEVRGLQSKLEKAFNKQEGIANEQQHD